MNSTTQAGSTNATANTQAEVALATYPDLEGKVVFCEFKFFARSQS